MSTCQQMNNYDLIGNRLSSMKTWNCEMSFNVENTNKQSTVIDLCAILKGDQLFIFPVRFLGVESEIILIIELKLYTMKAGFSLVLRSTIVNK